MIKEIAATIALAAVSTEAGEVRVGMTKSQVLAEVGRPNNVSDFSGHLQWSYGPHFNPMDLIPLHLALHGADMLTVTFNHGRVIGVEHD
jgi:outer membrane protein assembly factor BamE (lipoprotein component of BamABCDE complex)